MTSHATPLVPEVSVDALIDALKAWAVDVPDTADGVTYGLPGLCRIAARHLATISADLAVARRCHQTVLTLYEAQTDELEQAEHAAEQARATALEYEQDAMRYRFWREVWTRDDDMEAMNDLSHDSFNTPEQWDAIIDDAIFDDALSAQAEGKE